MTDIETPVIEKAIDGRTKEGRALRAAQKAIQTPAAQTATAKAAEQEAITAAARRPLPIGDPEPEPEPAVMRRNAPRPPLRADTRTPTREAPRGRGEVFGRNGERLSRKRNSNADPFHIEVSIVPNGWEYQWNAITVIGNSEVLADQALAMAENGWRPVPSERHPGRFMPEGHKGSILRGGCRLEERPKILSDEARAEDLARAQQLVKDRNESLRMVKGKLPDGFEMSGRYRGADAQSRMSIDRGMDIPQPSHQLAEPSE